MKVSTVRQDLMSDGSEFQVHGATTENARRASSFHVLGTVISGASDDRRGRTGTAVWIRSLKYAGAEEDIVLNVSVAILLLLTIIEISLFHTFSLYMWTVKLCSKNHPFLNWECQLTQLTCITAIKRLLLLLLLLLAYITMVLLHDNVNLYTSP